MSKDRVREVTFDRIRPLEEKPRGAVGKVRQFNQNWTTFDGDFYCVGRNIQGHCILWKSSPPHGYTAGAPGQRGLMWHEIQMRYGKSHKKVNPDWYFDNYWYAYAHLSELAHEEPEEKT